MPDYPLSVHSSIDQEKLNSLVHELLKGKYFNMTFKLFLVLSLVFHAIYICVIFFVWINRNVVRKSIYLFLLLLKLIFFNLQNQMLSRKK